MTDWADCLAIFLDSMHIKHAHVLGISWGGVLAQEFYKRHPEKVLSLILADTNAGWGSFSDSTAGVRLEACIRDTARPAESFVEKYLPGMFSDSVKAETKKDLARIIFDTHRKGFVLMAAAIAHSDMRRLLPNIKVPVLLVWGENDKRAPVSVAHEMNHAIPGSKLEIIKGCGHVSNMEQPQCFNNLVRKFCLTLKQKK
jgi:pimeloyl-ACP methyl ester carboxylesterase